MSNRRQFLAGAVPAARGLSRCFSGAQAWRTDSVGRTRAPRKVVVIGAGLARLAAGYELIQAGHDVTIVEARERPGGRVHTVRGLFSDEIYAEAGAHSGLTPDVGAPTAGSASRPEPAFTCPEAMRTAVFWSLSAANVLSNALGTGLLLNHYDLLARAGLPLGAAAIVFVPLAITQVLATLATGPVLDRLPPHRLVAVPMTMMTTACLLVGTIGSTASAIVYAAALGLALGSFQAINAAAYAHYFGRQHAGEIRGVTFVITIVGAALGPLPFGWFATRGYGPVLAGGAALCLLAAAINLATRAPEPRGPRA